MGSVIFTSMWLPLLWIPLAATERWDILFGLCSSGMSLRFLNLNLCSFSEELLSSEMIIALEEK
jgi:hypothetical protein